MGSKSSKAKREVVRNSTENELNLKTGKESVDGRSKHGIKDMDSLKKGYMRDAARLYNFFHVSLKYDVFNFTNCTQEELFASIEEVKQHIRNSDQLYDRLVFVISTHGNEDGLLTCDGMDPNKVFKETYKTTSINGQPTSLILITKIEGIVDAFKHDQLPELKDKPKMVLVQACRGGEPLKAAGLQSAVLQKFDTATKLDLPVDADILIYYASTADHRSWVRPDGSWFIQTVLDVFEHFYSSKHVEDMITAINMLVANKRGKWGTERNIAQMPCKLSTLRKLFYL